ncbi:HPF/RaiA family ribosome-associated protein [Luteolibacter arcticus]|uniref:HPF/RaiA family ribosome-associated protein n=1 Tax=Luteolibacter arcticus TaxID=1581411 RepID=A0ABT3GSA2_9BACT|nr:HPF/RaiA family ribosome-associated protein [Luteolibacter arcticus]MCW1926387.1 HPF/RaiA family ribosome-associated protein [Luteolibacter arcticus]
MTEVAVTMMVQVNTDRHIHGSLELQEDVASIVEATLTNHASRTTRVEVHLSDQNSEKGGDADVRCAIEARLEGFQPLGVHHDAAALSDAVQGAADRLERMLEHHLGRLESR